MSILSILFAIVVVGVLLWLVESVIPMDPAVKRVLQVVTVLVLVVWLLQAFGRAATCSVRVGR